MGLAKRIIPCLDVDAGRVVKGVNFVEIRDAGDPVEIARRCSLPLKLGTSRLPVLASETEMLFCAIGTAVATPSTFLTSSARLTGRRRASEPLRPRLPEARSIISAPTFASRCARSRRLPLARPTVNTISKMPIPMPIMLTAVRAGRCSIFENTRLFINKSPLTLARGHVSKRVRV